MRGFEAGGEQCGHTDCGYGQRLEYCDVEAADPSGSAAVVIELLDIILYATQGVTSDHYHAGTDNSTYRLERSFSYLHSDGKEWAWPILTSRASITHTSEKKHGINRYEIRTGWRVLQQATTESEVPTTYTLEVYPHGVVQASITEPDVLGQTDGSRRMTEYDMEQLFDVLQALNDMHGAEQRDNRRAND